MPIKSGLSLNENKFVSVFVPRKKNNWNSDNHLFNRFFNSSTHIVHSGVNPLFVDRSRNMIPYNTCIGLTYPSLMCVSHYDKINMIPYDSCIGLTWFVSTTRFHIISGQLRNMIPYNEKSVTVKSFTICKSKYERNFLKLIKKQSGSNICSSPKICWFTKILSATDQNKPQMHKCCNKFYVFLQLYIFWMPISMEHDLDSTWFLCVFHFYRTTINW